MASWFGIFTGNFGSVATHLKNTDVFDLWISAWGMKAIRSEWSVLFDLAYVWRSNNILEFIIFLRFGGHHLVNHIAIGFRVMADNIMLRYGRLILGYLDIIVV